MSAPVFINETRSILPNQPLWLNICAGPNVVLCGEDELVVENPLWLVVQTGGRVQLDNLVVLDGQVVPGALQVGNLKY